MPAISMFYGIIIRMFYDDMKQHNRAHIHAIYNEYSAVYSLIGEKLEGQLPRKQTRLVKKWLKLHQDELIMLWINLQNNGKYFVIKGLE